MRENAFCMVFPCEMDFSPQVSTLVATRWDSEICGEKNPSHMETIQPYHTMYTSILIDNGT